MPSARLGRWLTVSSLVLLVAGCGGPARHRRRPSRPGRRQPGDGCSEAPDRWRARRTKVFVPWDRGSTSGSAAQPLWLLDRSLTIQMETGGLKPVLAESIPSPERGDWRINPGRNDGTNLEDPAQRSLAGW